MGRIYPPMLSTSTAAATIIQRLMHGIIVTARQQTLRSVERHARAAGRAAGSRDARARVRIEFDSLCAWCVDQTPSAQVVSLVILNYRLNTN